MYLISFFAGIALQSMQLPAPILPSGSIDQYNLVEIGVPLTGTYKNPFDPEEVGLEATFIAPDGREIQVPGFYQQPYSRTLQGGKEMLTPTGPAAWKVRFCPELAGDYRCKITLHDKHGDQTTQEAKFHVNSSTQGGFVRVGDKDPLHFVQSDGRDFFALGVNLCWAGDSATLDYDKWVPALSAAGGNASRLWLSPGWTTFALEKDKLGLYDQANAWRLDYVLGLGKKQNVRFLVCTESYNILRDKDASPYWDKTPHNSLNGGPLSLPRDFWTSPEMDRLYRAKLRYLVARYGAFTSVLGWEFWNEVDLTKGYDADKVRAWHQRMGDYLASIDPYHHPRTTSFSTPLGERDLDRIPEIDFVTTHYYGDDPAGVVASMQVKKAMYGKPVLATEVGVDTQGPQIDPRGLQIHDAQWSSIATGAAGGAFPWWWDGYIAPKDLFRVLTPAAQFVKDVDWSEEHFRPATPQLQYATKPNPPAKRDLFFTNGPVSWDRTEANLPRFVKIRNGQPSGDLPLPGILHGKVNHPSLHNPVNFDVILSAPTSLEVEVGDVSGYGGATLQIRVDDKPVLTREFRDPDGQTKTETLTKFAGIYKVVVPAGKHVVSVENIGADWFLCSFRFKSLLKRTVPPLNAWAVAGDRLVLAWIRAEGYTWKNSTRGSGVVPSPPSIAVFKGLATGSWTAELWDTWTGTITETQLVVVGQDGLGKIRLPAISRDLAVKLRRGS